MRQRAWWRVLSISIALALVSLVSNITTAAQLSGDADTVLAIRFTLSRIVNSGTVWAGLPILAGWLVGRRVQAAAAGVIACLTALAVHYAFGLLIGQFDAAVWSDNRYWFAIAAILGAPLGLVGAVARRPDRWGLLARLVVPAGAILEPFYVGAFTIPAMYPWPDRLSTIVTGVVLLAIGATGTVWVIVRYLSDRRARPTTSDSSRLA